MGSEMCIRDRYGESSRESIAVPHTCQLLVFRYVLTPRGLNAVVVCSKIGSSRKSSSILDGVGGWNWNWGKCRTTSTPALTTQRVWRKIIPMGARCWERLSQAYQRSLEFRWSLCQRINERSNNGSHDANMDRAVFLVVQGWSSDVG